MAGVCLHHGRALQSSPEVLVRRLCVDRQDRSTVILENYTVRSASATNLGGRRAMFAGRFGTFVKIQDPGFRMDQGSRIKNQESRIKNHESRIKDKGSRIKVRESRIKRIESEARQSHYLDSKASIHTIAHDRARVRNSLSGRRQGRA